MTEEQIKERAAMAYGMFSMCQAAERMINYVLRKDGLSPVSGLHHEAKKYYNMITDGMTKALIGLRGFNERSESLFYKFGQDDGNKQIDMILRDSNEIIRDYCYRRNAIDTKEDAELFDNMCNNAQFWHPGTVISQETINKFKIK